MPPSWLTVPFVMPVALRGDAPAGEQYAPHPDGYAYASDLVAGLRRVAEFEISVAAYPEAHPTAESAKQDLDHLKRKLDAGATRAITQYFFDGSVFLDFLDRALAAGITAPIVPGIMPITNYSKLARFSDACGAEIPRWIRKQLEAYGDDVQSIQAFGEQVITQMCERLLQGGAPGLHFYTMNQAEATTEICRRLRL